MSFEKLVPMGLLKTGISVCICILYKVFNIHLPVFYIAITGIVVMYSSFKLKKNVIYVFFLTFICFSSRNEFYVNLHGVVYLYRTCYSCMLML